MRDSAPLPPIHVAKSLTVLVADDCAEALDLLAGELEGAGHQVLRARDGLEAWELFASQHPDAVVTDVRMPVYDGFELMHRIRRESQVPLLLITAHAEVAAAVSAVREGADDYLCFPEDLPRLEPRIRELADEGAPAVDAVHELLVGESEAIEEVRRRVRRQAGRSTPVVFRGESGTGRSTAARALHALGEWERPLLEIGEGDEDPVAVEGAVLLRAFERFSPRRQRRWVTELHRMRAARRSEHRLLITTAPAPDGDAQATPFHPEIWRHVSPFQIELPPLAERAADLPHLARALAAAVAREFGLPPVRISADALDLLSRQSWPRHLHDLRAVLDRAVAWADDGILDASAIREALRLMATQRHEGLARRRAARRVAERDELIELLEACGGNVAEMSRRLGLTRGAVVYRLKKHGLAP